VSYLVYELSSEANAGLYRIHDPCIIRRYTVMVPTYVHKCIKIKIANAGPSGRAVYSVSLRPLGC